jgi:hypothetical protein
MLPAHEEILSIQLVTTNKYARQVRSCAAGFTPCILFEILNVKYTEVYANLANMPRL